MRPNILIINDDQRLCETRKMLFEDCGAKVYTACGTQAEVERKLKFALDLALIDSTNVGFERGEQLCHLVEQVTPSLTVALLAKSEMGLAEETSADHLIIRNGPRQMLVRINELLGNKLDVNLWDARTKNGDEGSSI